MNYGKRVAHRNIHINGKLIIIIMLVITVIMIVIIIIIIIKYFNLMLPLTGPLDFNQLCLTGKAKKMPSRKRRSGAEM